mmetsp:Transcript_30671/g.56760  ORF Transcript_30671/g.56760 Transcript_30671/m.56760 type:complete len:370 (+) Transcript_30671:1245-2354(+)
MVHYGGDSGNSAIYRTGTIHFYHNTLLSTRPGKTTLVRLSSDQATMDARNNVIYVADDSAGSNLELLAEKRGTLLFTNNWVRPGYFNWVSATYGGSVTEVGTVLESGTETIFTNSNFDAPPYDLHLAASLDFSAGNAPGVTPVGEEYVMHVSNQIRSNLDLGAFGYGQLPPPPTGSPTSPPSLSPTTREPTWFPTSPPSSSPTISPTYSGYCSDQTGRCSFGGNASECGCFPIARRQLLKGREHGSAHGSLRRKLKKKTPSPTQSATPQPTRTPIKATLPPTDAPTKEPTHQPTSSPTAPVPCECLETATPTSSPTPNPSKPPTDAPMEPPTSSPTNGCLTKNVSCNPANQTECCSGVCDLKGQSWKCT